MIRQNSPQGDKQRMELAIRAATPADIPELKRLTLDHGPNPWNHLPEDEVNRHFDGVVSEATRAVVATDKGAIIGLVSFNSGDFYPEYGDQAVNASARGYIAEAVVHRDYVGHGIGTRLLEAAKLELNASGIMTIYVKRHEQNLGSAGMMRKAGFKVVGVFDDPIRTSGSRRTAVEVFRFS